MKKLHVLLFLLALMLTVLGLWWQGPIPQDPSYHDFADQRNWQGIPNFWDVVSNLPMFFLGVFGIWRTIMDWHLRSDLVANLIPLVLSFGMITACLGSAYYHWAPNNLTLVWDRLPMTLMFMPLFSLLIYDFIGEKEGRFAFWLLIPLGIFSVLYWWQTEAAGNGDLRFYAFVQFFPMVAAVLLVMMTPKRVVYTRNMVIALSWYVLAKLCEHFDDQIFDALHFWSGHTIKHLLSSVSLFFVLRILKGWRLENRQGVAGWQIYKKST